MFKYYVMVVSSTLLFSVQFVFMKIYQKKVGDSFFHSTTFSALTTLLAIPFFFFLNDCKIEWTNYSFWIATLYSSICILCAICGVKAMACENLSMYTMFLMLGGMLLPVFYGIFIGEKLNTIKVIACILVVVAMIVPLQKGKGKRINFKSLIFLVGIFVTNGLVGVLTFVHQKSTGNAVSAQGFLLLCNFTNFIMASLLALGVFLYKKYKNIKKEGLIEDRTNIKEKRISKIFIIAIGAGVGYTIVHSLATLLSTISAEYMNAGVQSTIGTGGCMVMSALFGLMFGEKLTKRTLISLVMALVGVICMIF